MKPKFILLFLLGSCANITAEYPPELTDYLKAYELNVNVENIHIIPLSFCEDCVIQCLEATNALSNESIIIILGQVNNGRIKEALENSKFTLLDTDNSLVTKFGFPAYEPLHVSIKNNKLISTNWYLELTN